MFLAVADTIQGRVSLELGWVEQRRRLTLILECSVVPTLRQRAAFSALRFSVRDAHVPTGAYVPGLCKASNPSPLLDFLKCSVPSERHELALLGNSFLT